MKLYFEAEKFIGPNKQHGSLQLRIFNDKNLSNSPKHVFAIAYSTLKYKDYIQEVIKKSKIKTELAKNKKVKISDNLLMLLVHDLLFSPKGRIQSGKHPIKDLFLSNKTRLQAEFTKLKLRYKVRRVQDLETAGSDDQTPVRWFRVNTILLDEKQVFEDPFFSSLVFVDDVDDVKTDSGAIYRDVHIPHLFGINPSLKLTNTTAYKDGHVIIQDRALCFPAHILHQGDFKHKEVIDATAAPGNKTTHSAQYMDKNDNNGVLYAFEKDNKRVQILKMMCERATGSRKDLIQITHCDFTTTNPEDFPEVTGLVVDPSCSGSGIFGRAMEDSNEEEKEEEVDVARLEKLAAFQFKIVKHAMSFPKANRVVYSTCSIHPQENERVVVDLLSDPELKKMGWTLDVRENVIPLWERRGWPNEFSSLADTEDGLERLAGGCVRSVPKEDGGIGFFAACFIKA